MSDEGVETPSAGLRPLTLLGDPGAVVCEGDACLVTPPGPTPGR